MSFSDDGWSVVYFTRLHKMDECLPVEPRFIFIVTPVVRRRERERGILFNMEMSRSSDAFDQISRCHCGSMYRPMPNEIVPIERLSSLRNGDRLALRRFSCWICERRSSVLGSDRWRRWPQDVLDGDPCENNWHRTCMKNRTFRRHGHTANNQDVRNIPN